MLGLARYAMKSPLHVSILAAIFALVPLLYIVSAALVALTTLRHGLTTGTRVLIAALIGGLMAWWLSGIPLSLLVLAISALIAGLLGSTQSWSRTLLSASVFGVILAVLIQSIFEPQLSAFVSSIQDTLSTGNRDSLEWQVLEALKPWVGYLISVSALTEALLALMLGRYWQAALFNPGGFRSEMHSLRLNRQELIAFAVLIGLALVLKPQAILLLGLPLVFVGIATVHGIVAKLNMGGQWLGAFYFALVLLNQIILPLLVLLVCVDSLIDIRSRISNRKQSDNE